MAAFCVIVVVFGLAIIFTIFNDVNQFDYNYRGLSIISDPKPVVAKIFSLPMMKKESNHDGYRGLSVISDPKSVVAKIPLSPMTKKESNHDGLRILTFGSSITWGAAIESRYDAYPYILSKDVRNLALRANGPNFPSVCTQTMVGDGVYDVVILEYFLRAEEGLSRLAKRIRRRFPNATIIFLRLWYPALFYHVSDGQYLPIREWAKSVGYGDSLLDPNFHQKLMSTPAEEFIFKNSVNEINEQNNAISLTGGMLWELPMPEDPREAIVQSAHLFNPDDWHHLSVEAHGLVANAIKQILVEHGVARQDEIGNWGDGDICQSWFATGECSLQHKSSMKMQIFAKKGPKWALHISEKDGGWLSVTNHFDSPRSLHLAYMVSGPPPSMYPKVRVTFDNPSIQPIILDPLTSVQDGHPVHVVQTREVAIIPPGQVTLNFEVLSEESQSPSGEPKQQFRLTGVAITGVGSGMMDDQVKATTFHDFSSSLPKGSQ